jgi:8-oxo-dGTP diphosphatase
VDKARQEVLRLYGNRLRLRVCGVCIQNDKILMLRHRGIGQTDTFWCPPGGGMQFGETTHTALIREFKEETGLDITVFNLLFINEFMQPPLHALELFFEVKKVGGQATVGFDPEMSAGQQIIQEMRWMTFEEIKTYPPNEVHGAFAHCESLHDFKNLTGYLLSKTAQTASAS